MKLEKSKPDYRKLLGFTPRAAIMAAVAILSISISSTSAPAHAASKPGIPPGITVVGDVDLTLPHVLSTEPLGDRSVTPCENLLSAAAPPLFLWSGEFRWISCSFWGATNSTTKNYRWYVSPQSNSQACAQGLGFIGNKYATWHYMGCGDSGATAVLWGNVAAYPKMKFQSLSGLVVPLYWY
jgi:hypothetical protein